ncbi:MAG: flagellar biosynthesis protein FlhA [Desulfococcaceae bacterium]
MATRPLARIAGPEIPFLSRNTDVLMALLVVGILMLMILPLPTILLDLLIAFNITFALILLLAALYVMKPLDLSTFPSLLLVVTLFRLSLNICSTRLILLHGHEGTGAAGTIIMAFGGFVVGGNYVVGFIVFLILVLINFLVITKGAGRIAEVAARFTLDAMPGKQMAIDADLNAGLLDEKEARRRREMVAREAEYYGAMDGANKFVKGDAIAGIIITLINIVGGLVVGVLQNDMNVGEAARNYTLLTVGDGLVTQIPALIVATAAGIVVTRAGAGGGSMGGEIAGQLLGQPHAIAVTAVILAGFGLIPGLPAIPFLAMALCMGGIAYLLVGAERERKDREAEAEAEETPAAETPETVPPLDPLALTVGHRLVPLVDADQDGRVLERIRSIRNQLAADLGVLVPPVRIRDDMSFAPGDYAIHLRGNPVGKGQLMPEHLLAMHIGASPRPVKGVQTREPTYGLPAYWIKPSEREDALDKGYTVVDLPTVLVTHLSEIVRRHAHELLGRQEVSRMLDELRATHPKAVDDLTPNPLPLGAVVRVLSNLLREGVPIRDMLTIVETLADWAPAVKDPDALTEYVRTALARTITRLCQAPDGSLPVITVGAGVEERIVEASGRPDAGGLPALPPETATRLMQAVSARVEQFSSPEGSPVLVCSGAVRPRLKRLAEKFLPNLTILSYNEIAPGVSVTPLATVELNDAH